MSDRRELRIGFLGCGLIGRSHATGLVRHGRSAIVAVHDPDRARAERFADDFSPLGRAAVLDDPEAVIEAVDAVYVCTWTSAHPDLVVAVAEAGRAVFCEKPLATTWEGATAMAQAVERAGVVHQVGLVLRHSPAFRWLRHRIGGTDAGPVMNVVFRDDQYLPTQGMYGSTWRGDRERAGGGALLEHSIHDLDLLEWMLGPIAEVSARMGSVHGLDGIDDQATVVLVAESGAHAALVSVWHDVLSRPSQRLVEVFCQGGYFSLEGDWNGPVRHDLSRRFEAGPGAAAGSLEGTALADAARSVDGLVTTPDEGFVDAVLAGQPAYPGFDVAVRAHRLADAAYRSAGDGGATIDVRLPADDPRPTGSAGSTGPDGSRP